MNKNVTLWLVHEFEKSYECFQTMIKHVERMFHHGLKTFERDKRLGFASTFISSLMFSYHDVTLKRVFHILHLDISLSYI